MALYPGTSTFTDTPAAWSQLPLTPPALSQQPPTKLHHGQPRFGHDGTGTTAERAGGGTRTSRCHVQETSTEEAA